jgi:hypothetical protein
MMGKRNPAVPEKTWHDDTQGRKQYTLHNTLIAKLFANTTNKGRVHK